jgi:hypothetical protein
MLVRVPILIVSGYYEYEVEAKNLPEATEKIKKGEATYCTSEVLHTRLNYNATYLPTPENEDDGPVSTETDLTS